jgi:4-hydroxybenzoate polyprenyltransferase
VTASERAGLSGKLRTTLEMIRFSHTLFALPFAVLSMVLAANGVPPWPTVLKILLAMVGARSAAMAHNRLADRSIDAANPRTAMRALPTGALSLGFVRAFLAGAVLLFFAAAATLNRLTLLLFPLALAILFSYAYTKRFTWASHLVLGLCLALAPVGAWIAVRGSFDLLPLLIGLAVLTWTAGFDVIYALQDERFDRQSVPARFGASRALVASAALHVLTAAFLFAAWQLAGRGPLFGGALLVSGAALVYQHMIVKPGDLSHVNAAFFTANGFVSIILCAGGVADVLVR